MLPLKSHHHKSYLTLFIVLLLVSLSCTLPGLPQPEPTNTPSEIIEVTEPTMPIEPTKGISGNILTEVAKSIYATVTQNAGIPSTSETEEPPVSTSEIPISTPTTAPTSTLSQPPEAATSTITPSTGFLPSDPDQQLWITPYFRVRNINLHNCGLTYAANFKVTSTTNRYLESVSLKFTDLSTGTILLGPETNNSPFLNTDRTCNIYGADSLGPYQTRYVGNTLGPKSLKTHTILANIKLCTKEYLEGTCHEAIVEFVVP